MHSIEAILSSTKINKSWIPIETSSKFSGVFESLLKAFVKSIRLWTILISLYLPSCSFPFNVTDLYLQIHLRDVWCRFKRHSNEIHEKLEYTHLVHFQASATQASATWEKCSFWWKNLTISWRKNGNNRSSVSLSCCFIWNKNYIIATSKKQARARMKNTIQIEFDLKLKCQRFVFCFHAVSDRCFPCMVSFFSACVKVELQICVPRWACRDGE